MKFSYTPQGVCSKRIDIEVDDDGNILDIKFTGGCNGNLQGICALVKGMNSDDVIEKLENIKCGMKSTSCPAQLAAALKEYI